MKVFDKFSKNAGLKPNKSKRKIAGISAPKGVRVALCSMQWISLNEETVKILGIHFSCNKKLEEEQAFNNHVAKMEKLLGVWRMSDCNI